MLIDFGWRMNKLSCVARALNKGDRSLAAIMLVHMELPAVPIRSGSHKAAKKNEWRRNYDPDEPRIAAGNRGGGEWTSDDFVSSKPIKERNEDRVAWGSPIVTPDCEEEWALAAIRCSQLMQSGKLGTPGYGGLGKSLEQCIRGQVSAACGGSPIH